MITSDGFHRFHIDYHLIDPEYTPFLNWNPNDPITVDSIAPAFNSLASMIRDGYHFDKAIEQKVPKFFSSLTHHLNRSFTANDLLNVVGQGSENPAAKFVDSMTVLFFSSHASIVKNPYNLIRRCFEWCSRSNRLPLFPPNFFLISFQHHLCGISL
ncbi:hypothetical protein BLNAU_17359 [Blattamonas nauphoetae]|uniref:Uncharacterized protein n=1 Tax=Blattamonas nauphoetae TaxID=2049346 RepID=A0ABQ9X7E8_9EUKA|nr:hypothetical protein BLNAU_17359 [Blattamonas nauphoetae]